MSCAGPSRKVSTNRQVTILSSPPLKISSQLVEPLGGATAVLVREHTLALQESADGTPRGTAALGGHTLRTLHTLRCARCLSHTFSLTVPLVHAGSLCV
mgnify:CR=1 FL=1